MAKIGDTFERNGATYTVVWEEVYGENAQKDGKIQAIGATRGKGKTLYSATVFKNGVIGCLMSMGKI